jgi:hypothetical protein
VADDCEVEMFRVFFEELVYGLEDGLTGLCRSNYTADLVETASDRQLDFLHIRIITSLFMASSRCITTFSCPHLPAPPTCTTPGRK